MQSARKLWEPSTRFRENANLRHFMQWLGGKGLKLPDYPALWEWSTVHVADFWTLLLEYFQVMYDGQASQVMSQREMPGIKWFEGIRLNYAEHVLRNESPVDPAIVVSNESGSITQLSWPSLKSQVSSLQQFLVSSGIKQGDRVAGYLPNIPEATIGLLAATSLGAVWSSCSPDFGAQAVIDRFQQIKPRILIATARYAYGGKSYDKRAMAKEVAAAIPSIEKVILIDDAFTGGEENTYSWKSILDHPPGEVKYNRVGFNDPLWILYSSGTTGLPKAITHSHGGVLLEQLKYLSFHQDVHKGDRCFWYTTTGWMMWNYLHGALLCGGTMVLYDGSPAYPDMGAMWKLAQDISINHFGTSAGFILACMKSQVNPARDYDLTAIRSIGSTGSTLPPEGFDWIYREVKEDVWLTSMSGGTDVCSAFVGGNPLLPVYSGEIQCRALGCDLQAWDDAGHPVESGEGEMVITKPMPCMPIYFWNDADGSRYRESYFETYPGIWRHGDWIEITGRGGVVIYGRSDATLNRGGVRIGTSEVYRTLDKVEEVKDSLIICVELSGGEFYMPLFVTLRESVVMTEALKKKINQLLRTENSPRHVPDEIHEAPDIPYTISGKKTETPVKKIMMGKDPSTVISKGSLRNPQSLDFFVDFYRSKTK